MDIKKMESSQKASDLASLNLIGSNKVSEEKRGEGYGEISEFQLAKSREGIRDEWLKLEVSYSDIKAITANFSEDLVIGEGGFGKVYQAKLDGQTVAIKILDSTSKQGEREFFQEPRQTIQDGFGGLQPPSRNKDKNEVMGATNPSSSSFFSEVEERGGEKLVRFNGSPFVFSLDDKFFTLTGMFSSTATREWLGDSYYWRRYMLTLKDGNKVVLKKLKEELGKRQMEFEEAANALEKIRHPNLLIVWGYYIRKVFGEMSLVLEVMPKGSLYNCLHCDGGGTKIDWARRMNIAMGIARGLNYIHNDMKVIHGNLTSHNIHLDENDTAKISDYELPRFTAHNKNCCDRSLCYRAPELKMSELNKTNSKSDVFSLGVILLELLTRKNPCNRLQSNRSLAKWAASTMEAEGPRPVLDRDLVSDALGVTNEKVATLLLALDCVNSSPTWRPEVNQVLHKLEKIKADIHAGDTYEAPPRRRRWWQK